MQELSRRHMAGGSLHAWPPQVQQILLAQWERVGWSVLRMLLLLLQVLLLLVLHGSSRRLH